ncbi:hypothetical protein AAY24_16430 [Sedimenticola thiotaurini]|uniref:Uncharacterized protein n=1 Tax=Sedimenticola thiotaurini TaxID=1543721 RepID=A0A0F7K383_9GAMM|nr:hypothetical protein AAY24_16430 [Sedimenticola thiotaurini]
MAAKGIRGIWRRMDQIWQVGKIVKRTLQPSFTHSALRHGAANLSYIPILENNNIRLLNKDRLLILIQNHNQMEAV